MIFTVSLSSFTCIADEDMPCVYLKGGYASENSLTTVTAAIDTELELAAYSITLNFDPSMLEFVSASCNTKNGIFFSGDRTDDQVTLIWSDSEESKISGNMFTVIFKTKSGCKEDKIPVEIGHSILGGDSTNEFQFETLGCEIQVVKEYLWGDVNVDGTVSIADVVMINRYFENPGSFSLTENQVINGDTDNNGYIDLSDYYNILNYVK